MPRRATSKRKSKRTHMSVEEQRILAIETGRWFARLGARDLPRVS